MRRSPGTKAGRGAAAILAALAAMGLAGFLVPGLAKAGEHWRDIAFWEDGTAAAPPVWTSFTALRRAGRTHVEASGFRREETGSGNARNEWRFILGENGATDAGLVAMMEGEGRRAVIVESARADAVRVEVARAIVEASRGKPARLTIKASGARELFITEFAARGEPTPPAPRLLARQEASGVLGTDAMKRDVFTGILLGARWALLAGIVVSFFTVALALALGLSAACSDGLVGTVVDRVHEFISLMPMLPALIVLSAVFKPSLWAFSAVATLFLWTRWYKGFYARAAQMRTEGYIEASRALGGGKLRRAVSHLLPGLLPLAFSSMALAVPGAILAEASVSLLGLGDPGAVTWGQMLHDALVQGAVVNRLWWWILPPGLMIASTSLAFVLLARSLDPPRHDTREHGGETP